MTDEARRDYNKGSLDESQVAEDPVGQFAAWFFRATHSGLLEPTAMTLATSTREGRPSARIVLLKSFGPDGFVFFTDYRSRKSEELIDNPRAALLFHWDVLERQVRILGNVSKISREQSDSYFRTRPAGSQLGAWASQQSSVLGSRADLEEKLREVTARFGDDPVPLPEHWGGWAVVPYEFEFWQGRPDRLHDRIRYRRHATGWTIDRLSP
jgi:pyridoxamine 5'-phosphate oxidase